MNVVRYNVLNRLFIASPSMDCPMMKSSPMLGVALKAAGAVSVSAFVAHGMCAKEGGGISPSHVPMSICLIIDS